MEATPALTERLNVLASQLPPQRLQEVVDFAEFLLEKEGNSGGLTWEQQRALDLIGIFEGPEDLAEKHDDYLVKYIRDTHNT